MRVRIVCYEDLDLWILGKFARKLQENLTILGIQCDIAKVPDLTADINHHIIYYNYNGAKSTIDTVMITHIDTDWKLELVRKQLEMAELGICFSSDMMNKLANQGVPREKLCYVLPAHDQLMQPNKFTIGLTSKIHNDARKREYLLLQLAEHINPNDFMFKIMGSGWEDIVEGLRTKGFEVEYYDKFNVALNIYLVPTFDYYLYLGLDEGAMGFVDALAAGVPTIVTPQGFHLDAINGITHSFVTLEELVSIFCNISSERRKLTDAVNTWTWPHFAAKHLELWEYLLSGRDKTLLEFRKYQDGLGSIAVSSSGSEHKQTSLLRILIIYDVLGWAWWHKANNLQKHLPPYIKIDTLRMDQPYDHEQYDFILYFDPYLINYASHVPPVKLIMGCSCPAYLDQLVELVSSARCVGGFVNNAAMHRDASYRLPNLFCCQNGVDEQLFFPTSSPPDQPVACWVGNTTSVGQKGLDIIREACAATGVHLLILDREANRDQEQLVSQEQIRDQLYHRARFYLCASETEGTPNPALEALACGLPVISTRVGNMPEIIRDGYNGYLVDRSVSAFCYAIQRLMQADWHTLSANARDSILAGWTWRHMVENYATMFTTLAENRCRYLKLTTLLNQADQYIKSENPAAQMLFEKALAIDPGNTYAQFNMLMLKKQKVLLTHDT